jgi:metallo-beta-lactamase family protein
VAPRGASLWFLGGVETVTGSRFLVEHADTRVLVDCGIFQGLRALRRRNWEPFPVKPSSIDAVVLTHAHLDHCGYLPALVRDGFRGPVFASPPTVELAAILLADAGHLQEEDAAYANRKGFSKHAPALPLYTEEDAREALRSLRAVPEGENFPVTPGVRGELHHAGHILGACSVELAFDGEPVLAFSGDLGRSDPPLVADRDPVPPRARTLVCESTYGDREHPPREAALAALRDAIRRALRRGGAAIVPAFAVDRTPALLLALRELIRAGELPSVPVFVDSPMALAGLEIYRRHPEWLDPGVAAALARGDDPFDPGDLREARTPEASRAINEVRHPCVIVSASGMAAGGRVLHHLKARLPDPRTSVVLVGFQAAGTRGRLLAEGAAVVKIHGRYVPVKATVTQLEGFSAHADRRELLEWLRTASEPPEVTYVAHGEPDAARALADAIARDLGWLAVVPRLGERVALG